MEIVARRAIVKQHDIFDIYIIYRPKRARKVPAHMQGGDFVYASTSGGASKQEQLTDTEKKGKKGGFRLSNILPSPPKKGISAAGAPKKVQTQAHVMDDLPDVEEPSEYIPDKGYTATQPDETAPNHETDEDTSDGDWYALI